MQDESAHMSIIKDWRRRCTGLPSILIPSISYIWDIKYLNVDYVSKLTKVIDIRGQTIIYIIKHLWSNRLIYY